MKKRTRLIAGVMAMMLTLGGCGSAANTANKKEATQTTAEQTCLLYTSDAADDLLCVDLGG